MCVARAWEPSSEVIKIEKDNAQASTISLRPIMLSMSVFNAFSMVEMIFIFI